MPLILHRNQKEHKTKKKHIYRAGEYYLLIHNMLDAYVRIDVIEIYLKNKSYRVNHIRNAIIDYGK